jgi:hypothetical protein
LQGRRSCTVPFKTAPCRFFFFWRKGKQNLGVTQNWVMTLMFFFGYVSVDFFPFLFPFVFAFCFCNSLFFFYVSFFMFLVLN